MPNGDNLNFPSPLYFISSLGPVSGLLPLPRYLPASSPHLPLLSSSDVSTTLLKWNQPSLWPCSDFSFSTTFSTRHRTDDVPLTRGGWASLLTAPSPAARWYCSALNVHFPDTLPPLVYRCSFFSATDSAQATPSKIKAGDFPGDAVVKNPPANAGDTGLSPGPGRSHMPQSN